MLLGDLFYCNRCYSNKRVRTFPVLCFYLPFMELLPGKCALVTLDLEYHLTLLQEQPTVLCEAAVAGDPSSQLRLITLSRNVIFESLLVY